MKDLNRRELGKVAGQAGVVIAGTGVLGGFAIAQGAAKVVVVGGGAGGATVAHQVKKSAPELDVTLVEVNPVYMTCFFSNLYIGGMQKLDDLSHGYDGLKGLGVKIVQDWATGVDAAKKTVTTKGGTTLSYDKLVLSPGIDIKFDSIAGYSKEAAEIMPHAWKAGPQTKLLKAKLEAMADGGVFVMAAPANPYRCPPGPYERLCMIAHYLKTNKPKSKIILLDAKNAFSKQPAFMEGFKKHYGDMIEVNLTNDIDSFAVVRVDAKTGEVETKSGRKEKAAVANIIPAQKCGEIASKAGAASGDWCPVKPDNMASALLDNVYVLGDASVATEMPKSAFSANSQAKVVANDIVATLAGKPKFPARYRNTCWSALAPGDGIKVGANYTPGEKDGKPALVAKDSFVSKAGEEAGLRKETYDESFGWYSGIVSDIFAKTA
ncbi:MAG: NAD(P)/FAD-dependent oxidoreductase [Hyphomicrobiaceae bacterium]|nr:NAD(P)/FAD-dependent oxidoreductase [Hyphomicrobiaceae bacterium]